MDIIATIGQPCTGNKMLDLIETCMQNEVRHFRFNFAKYGSQKDRITRAEEIRKAKEIYSIEIMCDIPYPYRKPRIFINGKDQHRFLQSGETLQISSSKHAEIFTDAKVITDLKIGSTIVYADGDAVFRVISKSDVAITIETLNECKLDATKAINFNHLVSDGDAKKYLDLISTIEPESIALSFVPSADVITNFRKALNLDCRLISKIENQDGIDNIDTIASVSDIMIARGDLSLYSDYREMAKNQIQLTNTCKKYNRRCYIATGILPSLEKRIIPAQSELIDISQIVSLAADGIILNYGVVRKNIALAADIVNYMTHK